MARGIEKLHPELKSIAEEFQRRCKAAGLNVLITETLRSKAEQEALYAKGRTKPGAIVTRCKYPDSPHCWGVAFDFCRNEKGREYVDTDGFFAKCGAVGKQLGLTWGGDFKTFVDKPHLELTKFMPNASCKTLKAKYGTPERFFENWPRETERPKEEPEMIYHKLADLPDWGKPAVEKLMARGALKGDDTGDLALTQEMLRMCVLLDRLGLCE